MTEEIKQEEQEETPAPEENQELSNSDLKSNPVFKKVTSELAQLRQEKADREAQEADSKAKAETEKLEAEGNYKAALELRDKQYKEQETKHAKDILQRDLKTELVTAGFKNSHFLKGAIGEYEGDSDGVKAYVTELAGLEENKIFLGQLSARTPLGEVPPAQGGTGSMTIEQAKELRSSPDKKIQAQAFAAVDAYFDKHGMIP